ncbi:hypothetical protein HaLaN_22151, partial [Haematococcus lacustris]
MSGLFNPFVDEEAAAPAATFSYYSDPLAAFAPGAGQRAGRGAQDQKTIDSSRASLPSPQPPAAPPMPM